MYSAILFDLDNTLIDRDLAFRKLLSQSIPDDANLVEELCTLDQHGYGNRPQLFQRWAELAHMNFDPSCLGVAIASHVVVRSELNRELALLANRVNVGILSNGSSVNQLAKWRAAKLDDVIPRNRLWISGELGMAKPDPQIFQHVCQELRVNPEHCLFVGDHWRMDIQGAARVGMNTQWARTPLSAASVRDLTARVTSPREYVH